MFETDEKKEKFLLVGLKNAKLDELEELLITLGGEVVEKVIQNLDEPINSTYLGKGKIEEIKQMIIDAEADGIICDDELTPAQIRNLEDELECKILDRTILILDIFAKHATTREGMLQVELAQLKNRVTRLVGSRSNLSRLGAGIGSKGPGEKKLEEDKRLIKERITIIKRELKEVAKNKELVRGKRQDLGKEIIAIVGYTNAGKSTLLNKLTDSNVLSEDKLFATLDTVTRKLLLKNKKECLITDTVGFIRKLPHHLIEAFKSTLEEAKYADLIINVVDSSDKEWLEKQELVHNILKELNVVNLPIITVYNKIDLGVTDEYRDLKANKILKISVKEDINIDELKDIIYEELNKNRFLIKQIFSFSDMNKVNLIRKNELLLKEEYVEDGVYIEALVKRKY